MSVKKGDISELCLGPSVIPCKTDSESPKNSSKSEDWNSSEESDEEDGNLWGDTPPFAQKTPPSTTKTPPSEEKKKEEEEFKTPKELPIDIKVVRETS